MKEMLDLSDMGYYEMAMAWKLLKAYTESRPERRPSTWHDSGVKLAFNPHSGCVFLVNDVDQVLMLDGDKLALYYTLPYAGSEGFIDELYDEFKAGGIDKQDYEQLADYLEDEYMLAEAEEVRKAIKEEH